MGKQWHNNEAQRHQDMGSDFLNSKGLQSHPELPGVMPGPPSPDTQPGQPIGAPGPSPDAGGPDLEQSLMTGMVPRSVRQLVPSMHTGVPNPMGHGMKHRRK